MTKKNIRFVQAQLNARGFQLKADGVLGKKTLAALDQVDGIPVDWPSKRKLIAFVQLLAKENGIEAGKIDGYWGPQTDFAADAVYRLLAEKKEPEIWRPEERTEANPNSWPSQDPESNLTAFYGAVGKNQTRIEVPYPHRLSWDKRKVVNSFPCHEKVHDSLHRVLTRVLEHYGPDEIRRLKLDSWGGCLNVRQMRGGSRYSMHSWGIALDYDPENNRLKWGRDRAAFARPEYETWWRLWEEEGWLSLGRGRNFDWMHVQAAKIS